MRLKRAVKSVKRPLAVISVVAFLFCFCVLVWASGAGTRDAFVGASIGEARILVPFLADDTASASICGMVYNGLTRIDKNLNVTGDLAESWDVARGGMEITFFLRKGVKWHDGEPFTSADVVFTYEKIMDPGTGCPYAANFRDIESVTAVGDHTVKFSFSRPYAPALVKLGMGIIPKHLFSGIGDMRSSPYARSPVGTGPYRFEEWQRGRYLILKANYDYYEHSPGIKRYVQLIIPDQSVQFLELLSGGIDSMELNPYQYRLRSDTDLFKNEIEKYEYLSHSYTYIGYNLRDPLFSDVRVRQALSLAIDPREIVDSVLLGLGEPCTGPFLKGSAYYDDSVPGYPYDMEKAKRLLEDAGWVDTDEDGILEKDGRELRFVLATNQGSQVREDAATVIQRQWAGIGVKVEIQVVAWAAFLDHFIDKKNFQAVILGWTLPVDPDPDPIWHSRASAPGGLNFVSYSDPEVDRLIDEGRAEFDPGERKRIYREIHRLISEDAPYTFLFFPYATPAVNRRFKGIEPAPAGIGYNFIDWYVPEDEVRYKF
ncbi:MAG: peptide-binding protein [Candidatus Omnitrophica bacterium]|nr:peptide-binding protein [Candidatus Omnitrophota bacterium]